VVYCLLSLTKRLQGEKGLTGKKEESDRRRESGREQQETKEIKECSVLFRENIHNVAEAISFLAPKLLRDRKMGTELRCNLHNLWGQIINE